MLFYINIRRIRIILRMNITKIIMVSRYPGIFVPDTRGYCGVHLVVLQLFVCGAVVCPDRDPIPLVLSKERLNNSKKTLSVRVAK
jgi:hypothetical protein